MELLPRRTSAWSGSKQPPVFAPSPSSSDNDREGGGAGAGEEELVLCDPHG